ncbi:MULTISPECIES: hypothetical protein [Paenibacillus]|uniref:hypothetical protein n=1 Tax=Paenibacillus TaxID=44249 RepID=UPI001C4BB475|nr:hypothetical protein [Paenibacillus lautus]
MLSHHLNGEVYEDPEDLEGLGCLAPRECLEYPAALGDQFDQECQMLRWSPEDQAHREVLECQDHLAALDDLSDQVIQAIRVIPLNSFPVLFPTIQMG